MEGLSPHRKIVISANSLWNILNFRRALLERLKAEGYEIIATAPVGDTGGKLPPELGVHECLRLRSDGLNPIADAMLFIQYLRLFARHTPAAYISFTAKPNIYGALAAGLLRIPAFPNVSGLGTAFIRGGMLQRVISFLYRLAFHRAPLVFFQNSEDRDLFVSRGLVRPDQARLLPGSGVDLERFQPPGQSLPDEPACTFLFVGRLIGDKGVREFVEAARLVKKDFPGSRFQLLGFAGAANRTAISADELNSWQTEGVVEYLGSCEDVRPYLAAADAVVLPSYREGLPRSLLEAAAMGRPLIGSDVPGNREIVIDGVNGFLCKVRSGSSLAAACQRFMLSPSTERARMGQASRRLVEEQFSEETVIVSYLEALSAINRSAGGVMK
jgi:glycosyltransferase involved in cell wall biosynthesis